MQNIIVGDHYTHYKRGGAYKIIHIGYLQSATIDDGKEVVVYEQLHATEDYPVGTVWVRTLEMFETCIIDSKGNKYSRFKRT
jgi:hypothetical protein